MIEKEILEELYLRQNHSMQHIADEMKCSLHKVSYWMARCGIPTRSISDAIYLKHNPNGDPFTFNKPKTLNQAKLLGLGLGLYWGEGTKANKTSVRLGNTDPRLIKSFMDFLIETFSLKKESFRFNLQIFSDLQHDVAIKYWTRELGVSSSQFTKTTVTLSGSLGTYRQKSQHGVITINYHNKKLRDLLINMLPT